MNIIKMVCRRIICSVNRWGHNVKTYVVYGMLYDIVLNLYKPYAAKFVQRLGGTELHISLVTSLPGLFAVLTLIPCSIFLARLKDKQKITALFIVLSRAFLPLMALTPFLPDKDRATVFVIVLSAMNFPDSVSQASLQSFLGDIFHPRKRAEAIAVRSKFGNLATCIALIISCVTLNYAASTNEQKIVAYQIFFVVAFLLGLAETAVFLRLKPEKSQNEPMPFHFRECLPEILRNRKFITFCLMSFIFHFAYFMGFPLTNIVQIKKLEATELWVGITAITSVLTIVLGAAFWGRMLTKEGTGKALALSSVGLAINCLLMAIAPNPPIFSAFGLFGGFFNCGVVVGVLNGLLEATPDKDRVVYVGVFQTFVNLTLVIAPLFAHFVNRSAGMYAALGLTAILRLICGAAMYLVYGKKPLSS